MTLGGHLVVHNGNAYDYCWKECLQSLLPICDKVMIVLSGCTDDTPQEVQKLARENHKIIVGQFPWSSGNMLDWIKDATWQTHHALKTEWWIQMDADEILDEADYGTIRNHLNQPNPPPGIFHRRTFFRDHRQELKDGVICSNYCHRLGPINVRLCGDLESAPGAVQLPVTIWHYGHIRRPKAWLDKSVEVHMNTFGALPDHWQKSKDTGDVTHAKNCIGPEWLRPFTGTHPRLMHRWLRERGYEP